MFSCQNNYDSIIENNTPRKYVNTICHMNGVQADTVFKMDLNYLSWELVNLSRIIFTAASVRCILHT